ncbi:MAG: hypothetical protein HY321_07000 [Armatimonadetes bacterium]|nr:hypothetical protein [Armatimonadota bacterium]
MVGAATLREQVREVVDSLPEEELVAADRFLRFLRDGACLSRPNRGAALTVAEGEPQGVWDWLQSLAPVPRTGEEWAAIERELEEEREAWDR